MNEKTPVTAEELRQYIGICKNIQAIESEREALYNPVQAKNYASIPSTSRNGVSMTERAVWKILELDEKLEEIKQDLINRRKRIEAWLSEIDPEVSAIIRVHFLQGKSWTETNQILYGYPDKDYPRKKFRRFMEKNERSFSDPEDL